jgi:antitoxin (DNA-binding transcriptional repressor) of toxin-antitoxin stability system
MSGVGAFEAKNKLGQPLDPVGHGEKIIITRDGMADARFAPPHQTFNRELKG